MNASFIHLVDRMIDLDFAFAVMHPPIPLPRSSDSAVLIISVARHGMLWCSDHRTNHHQLRAATTEGATDMRANTLRQVYPFLYVSELNLASRPATPFSYQHL